MCGLQTIPALRLQAAPAAVEWGEHHYPQQVLHKFQIHGQNTCSFFEPLSLWVICSVPERKLLLEGKGAPVCGLQPEDRRAASDGPAVGSTLDHRGCPASNLDIERKESLETGSLAMLSTFWGSAVVLQNGVACLFPTLMGIWPVLQALCTEGTTGRTILILSA